MISHENGHFIFNQRTSFRLPNGLCFNYDVGGIADNQIDLMDPETGFHLGINFLVTPKSSLAFTEELFDEKYPIVLEPIHVIETPTGLKGYATTYQTSYNVYEEYVIELPGEEPALMNVWTQHRTDKPDSARRKEAVAEILASTVLI